MVHEQKFKDLLSSTCQLHVERRVFDLESEAMGSIPTGGNILSLEFFCFPAVKAKMPILAFLCVCEKPELLNTFPVSIVHVLLKACHNCSILYSALENISCVKETTLENTSVPKYFQFLSS